MKKKKEKIKGRARAIIAMILMLVISLPIGCCLSLSRERETATDAYYGTKKTPGLLEDLAQCRGEAANLVTLGGKYLPQESELLQNVRNASGEMENVSEASKKATAFTELTMHMQTLYNALSKTQMKEQDKRYCEEIYADFNASADMIARSEYNILAAQFNELFKNAPARPLASLIGIDELEIFADAGKE